MLVTIAELLMYPIAGYIYVGTAIALSMVLGALWYFLRDVVIALTSWRCPMRDPNGHRCAYLRHHRGLHVTDSGRHFIHVRRKGRLL